MPACLVKRQVRFPHLGLEVTQAFSRSLLGVKLFKSLVYRYAFLFPMMVYTVESFMALLMFFLLLVVLTDALSSRRAFLQQCAVMSSIAALPQQSLARNSFSADTADTLIPAIIEAQTTLHTLLNNWDRATVDCTFADVPRDLLEQKNKALLLEKASTFALFDKSVSVETCKTTNRIVRSYLGLTGVGPLVGIDKVIRKALNLVVHVDMMDSYVEQTESFSESISKAASLSYAAGLDMDSVNNFAKGNVDRNANSNLEQSRIAIEDATAALDKIVDMLIVT